MIKTMLLTAQLALSPIVGTNGLQPKRLPNPVYGESIDYSVTYQGKTFERILTGNYYAESVNPFGSENAEVYIGYENTWNVGNICSDDLTWIGGNTNIQKTATGAYTTWEVINDSPLDRLQWYQEELTENLAFAYTNYYSLDNQEYYSATQVLVDGLNGAITKTFIWLKEDNNWIFDEEVTMDSPKIYQGDLYFYLKEELPLPNRKEWLFAWEQPTIANPSVYDNIYNFYYQNLFANEALDELGAEVGNNSLTMRQWLAHTATIVSISLLACALVVLVIKIFKLIAGSISDIWG